MKIINFFNFLSLIVPITVSSVIRIDDAVVPTQIDLEKSDILTSGVIDIDFENGLNIKKRQYGGWGGNNDMYGSNVFQNPGFGANSKSSDNSKKDHGQGIDFNGSNNDSNNGTDNGGGNSTSNNNTDNNNSNNSSNNNTDNNNISNNNDGNNTSNGNNTNGNGNGNNNDGNNNSGNNDGNNNNSFGNGNGSNGNDINGSNGNGNILDQNTQNGNSGISQDTQILTAQPTVTQPVTSIPATTVQSPTSSPTQPNDGNGTVVDGGKKEKVNYLSTQFIVVYCVLGGIGLIILILTISALIKSIRRKHSSKDFGGFSDDGYYDGYFGYQNKNITQPRPTYDFDARRPTYNQYEVEYGSGGNQVYDNQAYDNQVYDNQGYQQGYGTLPQQGYGTLPQQGYGSMSQQNYGTLQYQQQNYGSQYQQQNYGSY